MAAESRANSFSAWRNPFATLTRKADDLSDAEISKYFQAPYYLDEMSDRSPYVIEGPRGSGKSMALKYLSLPVQLRVIRDRPANQHPSYLDFIGVYVKLDRGLVAPLDERRLGERARPFFEKFLHALIAERIFDTLGLAIRADARLIDPSAEERVVGRLYQMCGFQYTSATEQRSFLALAGAFREIQRALQVELNTKLEPDDSGISPMLVGVGTFLDGLIQELRALGGVFERTDLPFYLLLDQYDQLSEQQQVIANTLIRRREPQLFYVKFGCLPFGWKARHDVNGMVKQEPHDFRRRVMDWDPFDIRYSDLLKAIANKSLREARGERPASRLLTDIEQLLQGKAWKEEFAAAVRMAVRVPPDDEVLEKVARSYGEVVPEVRDVRLSAIEARFGVPILFRELERAKLKKIYSGYRLFRLMSSGIVYNFIQLCYAACEAARAKAVDIYNGVVIPPVVQSSAVRSVANQAFENIRCKEQKQDFDTRIRALCKAVAERCRNELLRGDIHAPTAIGAKIIENRILSDDLRQVLAAAVEAGAVQPMPQTESRASGLDCFTLNRMFAPEFELPADAEGVVELRQGDIEEAMRVPPEFVPSAARKRQQTLDDLPLPLLGPTLPSATTLPRPVSDDQRQTLSCFIAIPLKEAGWQKTVRAMLHRVLKVKCRIESFDALTMGIGETLLEKILAGVQNASFCICELTELNPNVMFELGIAQGVGKPVFLFWTNSYMSQPEPFRPEKQPKQLQEFEWVPYDIEDDSLHKLFETKVLPAAVTRRAASRTSKRSPEERTVLVEVPGGSSMYWNKTIRGSIERAVREAGWRPVGLPEIPLSSRYAAARTTIESVESCVIDITGSDKDLIFDLGLAFALGRKPLAVYDPTRGSLISDWLGRSAADYRDDEELTDKVSNYLLNIESSKHGSA